MVKKEPIFTYFNTCETSLLSNLQLELLRVFNFELSEEQLKEIRALLADYFAEKVTSEMDALFEANDWGEEKIEEWSKECIYR